LRYWYGYSYAEISDSLSLTISAVKSRLHRARKELAHQWLNMDDSKSIQNPSPNMDRESIQHTGA